MSSGFYLVSGFLYLNMSSEIMFVLANRMTAQKINMAEVGDRILCDITLQMFKPNFVDNIVRPQVPLSFPALYAMYTQIVNSSHMKLNKPSMEKLFYLILMTFKKQVFMLSSPLQFYTLTLTHLQDVMALLKSSPQATECLKSVIEIYTKQAAGFTFVNFLQLKEEIMSMLESYNSKIVLFCQTGAQDENGNLVFSPRNTHHRKSLGSGLNHPPIALAAPPAWEKTKNLQYSEYKTWKTTLGKDDYDNARGSSQSQARRGQKVEQASDSTKQLSQLLGINRMNIEGFEVQLELFGSDRVAPSANVKKQTVKTTQAKAHNDIKSKIEKQFKDLKIGQEEAGDDIDLLELMDS